MDRLRMGLAAGWFASFPFILLGAPGRWGVLAAVMGAIIGLVLYSSPQHEG